jgi:hypothetical protein
MMQKIRNWLSCRRGALVGAAAGLLWLAVVTLGQAATEPQGKGQGIEKPVQGQQLCPATPGAGVCQIKVECPPIEAPGKTACRATIDCPGVKQPVKPKKKPIIE